MRVKIIECPRDAMQGLDSFVPTDLKVEYLNALLKVGFHTLDCGSFVSPKAIPQMRDTSEVLSRINPSDTKLSVIVANKTGIDLAVKEPKVDFLGYPFSVSNTFQNRNTNKSLEKSVDVVEYLATTAEKFKKEVVIYISMGFGNPYGDYWHQDIVTEWVEKLSKFGVRYFSISDTVGVSTPQNIQAVYNSLVTQFENLEFGAHFHTKADNWKEKVETAWQAGCSRFDGAIAGFGGCPMADDELVGNMPTENLVDFFTEKSIETGLDNAAFLQAKDLANKVFGQI